MTILICPVLIPFILVLENFLLPQEVIRYQSEHEIEYGSEKYVLYITNRRVLGHKRKGFILKKDRLFSVALEEVGKLDYDEQGMFNKKGILHIQTKTVNYRFEGKVEDVKLVWKEMQQFLGHHEGRGAPSAYDMSNYQSRNTQPPENVIPKEAEEFIKVLKMRLVKGEINEEEFLRIKKTIES